ncbi:hypothetical protein Smp_172360 [Schistosoma mansoni]|uniref:Cytochrome P450 n=1 Tax=Schistosoma mansoni TaxID=6183 RepID=G4VAN4_SCHMA|nr:hypothetical protein Smp_172360 [Schistosoma mansoni]|eukprot:XP_018648385.1 hypothetical protein Smp_172360 [Schistosoma mansoni]
MNSDIIVSILKETYEVDKIKEAVKILEKFPSIPPKWFVDNEEVRNISINLLNDIYKLSRRRRINSRLKMEENGTLKSGEDCDVKLKSSVIRSPYIQEEDKSTYWIPIDVFKTVSQNQLQAQKKSNG